MWPCVERRFGKGALHFYTWSMMVFRVVGAAGALYAIAILTVAVTRGGDTPAGVAGMPPALVTAIIVFAAVMVLPVSSVQNRLARSLF